VAFEEIAARDWAEQSTRPEILGHPEKLYQEPGYDLSDLPLAQAKSCCKRKR
jgi:hypothetical protein